jgi:hypothetical protein
LRRASGVDCQRIYYAKGLIDDYFVKHIKRRRFTLDDVLWFPKDHYEMKRMYERLTEGRSEQQENASWKNKKLGLKYGSFNLDEYLSNSLTVKGPTQSPC